MSDAELDALLADISACRICRDMPKGGEDRRLPHEPNPVCRASASAPILIAGQAPGIRVHKSGVPFTDPSGDRLRAWLGVSAEEFYDISKFAVVPMGFCFPGHDAKGGDLPPRVECAPAWRDKVMRAMPQVRLVLAVGLYAQRYHLDAATRGPSLTETVRRWRRGNEYPRRPAVVPLPHPSWRNNAWIRKNPWFETDLLPDLRGRVHALLHS